MSQGIEGFDLTRVQGPQPVTSPLSESRIDVVFFVAMRNPGFFLEARQHLQPHMFDRTLEPHYMIIWTAMIRAYDSYGRFEREMLLLLAQQVMEEMMLDLTPTQEDAIVSQHCQVGLIVAAWHSDDPTFPGMYDLARDCLRQLLRERTIVQPLRRLMQHQLGNPGAYPANLPELLEDFVTQERRIAAVSNNPTEPLALGAGQRVEPAVYTQTGLDWVDNSLGGQRHGAAHGLIGVSGCGKTTLAIHMAVSIAKRAYADSLTSGRPLEHTAFFTYEQSLDDLRPYFLSAACHIERAKMERLREVGELSTTPEDYERFIPGNAYEGDSIPCELDRYRAEMRWFTSALHCYDLSGSEKFPEAGRGYIPEIVGIMDRHQQETGCDYRSVLLDYAGLACRRHMESANMDDNRLRAMLTRFGDQCRREIAQRFRCAVWIVHQIRGDAGSKSAVSLMHHTDAAESKAFAENLIVCGCIGVPDPRTGCRRLNWSKIRHKAQESVSPVTLRINDYFAIVDDVTPVYRIDETGRCFQRADEAAILGGAEAAQERRQRQLTGRPEGLRSTTDEVVSQANPNSTDLPL